MSKNGFYVQYVSTPCGVPRPLAAGLHSSPDCLYIGHYFIITAGVVVRPNHYTPPSLPLYPPRHPSSSFTQLHPVASYYNDTSLLAAFG